MSETQTTTLVERLEDVRCDREPFTDAHKHCICRLTNEAAREITSLRSQLEEARALVGGLSDPVVVHANMLRGAIAKPSLTSFLHAMGNHALVAIRETVAIAERNEKSKYVERARHLLDIVTGSPPANLVEEARAKAIEECAGVLYGMRSQMRDREIELKEFGQYGLGGLDTLDEAINAIRALNGSANKEGGES